MSKDIQEMMRLIMRILGEDHSSRGKIKYEALLIQTASSALRWFWSPADTYSLMKEYSEGQPTETFSRGHKAINAIES